VRSAGADPYHCVVATKRAIAWLLGIFSVVVVSYVGPYQYVDAYLLNPSRPIHLKPPLAVERMIEPVGLLIVLVSAVVLLVVLMGLRLSRRWWVALGVVLVVVLAPATVAVHARMFTAIDMIIGS